MLSSVSNLDLDVVSLSDLKTKNHTALKKLQSALYGKGLVAVDGIDGIEQKISNYMTAVKKFFSLKEEVKTHYCPKAHEQFLGYEKGKEKFQREDGVWVVDDLKTSFYAKYPDNKDNKWPIEVDLKTPFLKLSQVMAEVGSEILSILGIVGEKGNISTSDISQSGRMLYYCKDQDTYSDNPNWCGAHYDHGLFTCLLPAFYYCENKQIEEPPEAGLFIKPTGKDDFEKVMLPKNDLLLFQVGEFAQLLSDDAITATKHKVQKAQIAVERYTLALFFDLPGKTIVRSSSSLSKDTRYGTRHDKSCSYGDWAKESFFRYHASKAK